VQQLVLAWIAVYGAAALFGLLMLGIVGLPVPDETLLTFAGVLVGRGTLSFIPTWLAGVLGGISGITCSYFIGRTTGLTLVRRYGKWVHLDAGQIERAGRWLSRRGKWSLTFGYFIPGVRHVTGVLAGTSGLEYRVFATFAYLGAFLWATGFVLLGWYASEEWEHMLRHTHRAALALVILATAAGGIYFLLRRRSRR
jgi:membrane protein DedA with SNARE-associated domain